MTLQKYITAAKAMQAEKPGSPTWMLASEPFHCIGILEMAALLLEADALLPKWRPIEDYDGDDSEFLVGHDREQWTCAANFYDRDGWWRAGNHPTDAHGFQIYPTHFMPLPGAPK